MSKGVLIFARNNDQLDYVKQAYFLATRVKKYLDVPVTIATENTEYLKKRYDLSIIDKIIDIDTVEVSNSRNFKDGTMWTKTASFKNIGRADAYDISPYDETLLLDSDYIISNSHLKQCFESKHDFLIYKDATDISRVRNEIEFDNVSDSSVPFYWATCVFFRKTEANRIYFDLVKHIQENYVHYRKVYQITSPMFRNDYAFSIAIHIMNGFGQGTFAYPMPGNMWYSTDNDILWDLNDDNMFFLIEKEKHLGEYTPIRVKGRTVHIMNKFSLERIINKELGV
jgi:hypothetical protein